MKKLRTILLTTSLSLTSLAGILLASQSSKRVNADANIPAGQTKDTIVDVISVSDLSFSGLSGQSMIAENKNTDATFSFSGNNVNKNLVFKFKYDVVDDNTSDSNAFRVHFDVADDKWNDTNSLWVRGDGVYFKRYQNDAFNWKNLPALTKGLHEIEFGRIALLDNGNPTGNYYVYYNLDGQKVRDDINPYDVSKMDGNMFINFSAGNTSNKIYDANLTYENPQVVGVSDLQNGNLLLGNTVPNKGATYNYSTLDQPANKSTVFVADVDYKAAEDSQIYITTGSENWNQAGYIWFQKDKTYFGITDANGAFASNKEVKYGFTLEAGTQHSIEYGRLAVMNGDTFTGKYHVYFKLDGNLVYAVDQAIVASVVTAGSIHITGNGGFNYTDSRFTYETPKEISVGDLKKGGELLGHTLNIEGNTDLTYDNADHTANYSLVFNFQYEAKESKNNQLHFTSSGKKWDSASSIILNNSDGKKVHLGKSTAAASQAGWYDINYAMTAGTTYNVEYGRLAIMQGEVFTGRYYVYLKINDEIVKEERLRMPQEVVEGNTVFVTADGKNALIDKDYHPAYLESVKDIETSMKLGFAFKDNAGEFEDVKCVLGFGVDKAIGADLVATPYTYGIEVSTAEKKLCFTSEELENGDLYYTLINLGDVINNSTRAADLFTVRAYIEAAGYTYFSEVSKTYSVKTLVDCYLEQQEALALNAEQVEALEALKAALA